MAIVCGFLLAMWMAWRSPNYVMPDTPAWDSGGAIAVTKFMHGGRVLYRDIFDHKQPLMYALLYPILGGEDLGVDRVRYLEKGVAAAKAGLIALIVTMFLGRPFLGIATAVLFVFTMYNPVFFNGGNFAEEYGNLLLLMAVGFCCPFFIRTRPRLALCLVGVVCSLAGLMKEPFAIVCLPWLGYVIVMAGAAGFPWGRAFFWAGFGLVAAVLPFVAYFLSRDALSGWLYIPEFNLQYAKLAMGGPSSFRERFLEASYLLSGSRAGCVICLAAALPGLVNRRWERERSWFPFAALLGLAASFIAAIGLTNRFSFNYRIYLVPMWCLFLAVAVESLRSSVFHPIVLARARAFAERNRRLVVMVAGVMVASLLLLAASFPVESILLFRRGHGWAAGVAEGVHGGLVRVGTPAASWRRPETTLDRILARDIVARDGILMMYQRTALYYPMHSLLPPTKPFYGISNGLAALRPDYLEQCTQVLLEKPPAVFIGEREFYGYVIDAFRPALERNYQFIGLLSLYAETPVGNDGDYLKPLHWYVRKDLVPDMDERYQALAGRAVDTGRIP